MIIMYVYLYQYNERLIHDAVEIFDMLYKYSQMPVINISIFISSIKPVMSDWDVVLGYPRCDPHEIY